MSKNPKQYLIMIRKFQSTVLYIFAIGLFVSCTPTKATTQTSEPVKKEAVVMEFDNAFHDFGPVKKGEDVTHVYSFVNAGTDDISIELVSGCHCTSLEWPEGKTFKPGEGGKIKATFHSDKEEEHGELEKTIDIMLYNTDERGYQIFKELKYRVVTD